MDIIFICILCLLGYIIFRYRPTIDILELENTHSIYLKYDKWQGIKYKGRTCKYLFTI